jgi:hypothetical protein
MADEFYAELVGLTDHLRGGRVNGLAEADSRDACVSLARAYFERVRPGLAAEIGENASLPSLDKRWQTVIRLAHGKKPRKVYVAALEAIREQLVELTVATLSNPKRPSQNVVLINKEEARIVETLEQILPNAAKSYRQGITDIGDVGRISFRGAACEFRECLREVIDYFAPDGEVMAESGFKLEPERKTPTTKQKIRFIRRKRRRASQLEVTEEAVDVIRLDDAAGALARSVQSRAAATAHAHHERDEVRSVKRYADAILCDLLEIGG